MCRILICSTFAFTLCACGGGSSNDAPTTDGTVTDTVVAGGNNESTNDTLGNDEANTGIGDTGNSSNSDVTQFGIVNFEVVDTVDIEATFFSIAEQTPSATLIEQFRPGEDTCEVSSVEIGSTNEIPDFTATLEGPGVNMISAGQVLTISSPAGSYAELLRDQTFGFIFYSIEDELELSAPAPNNLSISIPGDEFAAFTNIALPAIEPLQVSSPGISEAITASTVFSWTGSSNPDSFIEIYAVGRAATSNRLVTVDCEVIDDGSFEFSAATQAELGAFDATGSVERYTIGIEQQGSSVLFLSTLSERVN